MEHVEDTKGNNGDKGIMRVTNLRLIWHASNMPRINITIGWNCITGVQSRQASSRVRGSACEAVYVLAKVASSATKFEFIFTTTNTSTHSRLFTTINSLHRAYETTKLYRELKMRGSLIEDDGSLRLLPQEYLCERVKGVWNLSTDQGNLGVFVITNCRVVWYAELNPLYNVSVPYLTLYSCRIRESKFGLALVLETTSSSGEYVLGFRIDPGEKLQSTCKSIQALHKAHLLKPIYGVSYVRERGAPKVTEVKNREEELQPDNLEDDVEIETHGVRPDAFAAYFDGGWAPSTEEKKLPVLSSELGLSIEPLLQLMVSLTDRLMVVFCETEADDLLFQKALEWTEGCPDDVVFWVRRKPICKIPSIPTSWAAKIWVLKQLRFRYAENVALTAARIAGSEKSLEDVAAIFVTVDGDAVTTVGFATLLALLAQFCVAAEARAVVAVNVFGPAKELEKRPEQAEEDTFDHLDESFSKHESCSVQPETTQLFWNLDNDPEYIALVIMEKLIDDVVAAEKSVPEADGAQKEYLLPDNYFAEMDPLTREGAKSPFCNAIEPKSQVSFPSDPYRGHSGVSKSF
ncbi:unnamed protein product [Caenorhabditis auriculariae]|uniref:BBSome complex member BBS5 PH domain-containing protein n=1 Tax=Caenorhabditis auriculariae TaxID=2777116 RepID=A0A8S1H2A8_9PELO|nr:unnamed protein product [Caenorhabditis auriculariae]